MRNSEIYNLFYKFPLLYVIFKKRFSCRSIWDKNWRSEQKQRGKGEECEPKMTSWQPTANEVLPLCSNRAADMRTQSNWCYNCVFRTLFRRWRTIYQPVTQIGAAFWDSLPAIKNDVNEKLPGKKLRLQPESLFFPPTGKKMQTIFANETRSLFYAERKDEKIN